MPYWGVYCVLCGGYLADALLKCVPLIRRSDPAFRSLFLERPGGALACPYCDGLIGFNDAGRLQIAPSGWPVFRYGRTESERKRQADDEPSEVTLADWALRHRFTKPGQHLPLKGYTYAEDAPADETVP